MLYASLGLAVMIACGLLLGWRVTIGPGEFAAAVGLLLLLRFVMVWAGMLMTARRGRRSTRAPPAPAGA